MNQNIDQEDKKKCKYTIIENQILIEHTISITLSSVTIRAW